MVCKPRCHGARGSTGLEVTCCTGQHVDRGGTKIEVHTYQGYTRTEATQNPSNMGLKVSCCSRQLTLGARKTRKRREGCSGHRRLCLSQLVRRRGLAREETEGGRLEGLAGARPGQVDSRRGEDSSGSAVPKRTERESDRGEARIIVGAARSGRRRW